MKAALMKTGADFRRLDDLGRIIYVSNLRGHGLGTFRRMLMPLLQGVRGPVAVADDHVTDLLTNEEISAFVHQVKKSPGQAILTAYEPRQHPYLYFAYGEDNSIRHIVSAGERQRGFRQQYPDVLCWWPVLAWFPEAEKAAQGIDRCDFESFKIKDPTQRMTFFAQFRHPSSLPGGQSCWTCAEKPFESAGMVSLPSRANRLDMHFIHIPVSRCGADRSARGFHEFKDSRSFWIQDTPLTRCQWHAVMGSGRPLHGDPDLPETGRSFIEIVEFINVLNTMGLGGYRLPRAHEWEHACRAGTETDFFFDAMEGTIDDFAWYRENSGGRTHPVARKLCNPWGLYDMAGNVREYTFDTYMPGAESGGVPVDLKKLVPATIVQVRGGGFNSRRDQLRSSHFAWVSAKEYKPNPSIGLRLVYISEDDQENQACD